MAENRLQVVCFGRAVHIGIGHQVIQGGEILRIAARQPISLGNPQPGRCVILVQRQGFIVIREGGRIVVHADFIIAQHRQYIRRGVLIDIFFQTAVCFFDLPLLTEQVEPGHDRGVALAHGSFDGIQGAERLFILPLLEIQVDQVVLDFGFLREIGQ